MWMPIIGFWCVLFLISKTAEGGRDWSSFLMMGVAGTAALVFVWWALEKLTAAKRKLAEPAGDGAPVSRAKLIYGNTRADDEEDEEG